MNTDYEKLKEVYSGVKENHFKLKNEFEDLIKKYEGISNQFQEFIKICYEKLKNKFPINKRTKENTFSEVSLKFLII